MVVIASHDPWVVVLSVAISILAAYAARDLAERVRAGRGRAWLAWLAGAAVVDGIGIWSVHFTGMLALRLPVPLQYDGPLVLLSLLAGMAGSAAALLIDGRLEVGWGRAILGAIALGGIGISGLHYTAMSAMRLDRYEHRNRSAGVAVLAIAAAIALVAAARRAGWHSHIAAALRGAANPAMHYIAMAAVVFTYSDRTHHESDAIDISALGIPGVAAVPALLLIGAILMSRMDKLKKHHALLDELFENAPHPVSLLSRSGEIARINQQFTRVFGYGTEVIGRNLAELIVPDEERAGVLEQLGRAVQTGERFEWESMRRRKDGTSIPVIAIVVPVSVPADDVEICLIHMDISERKAAEEAQRMVPRRLIETQENERKRIARELHDEIGQVLTSAVMMLTLSKQLPHDAAQSRIAESKALLEDLIDKVRGLALDLRPSVLDHFGLAAALSGFFTRFTDQTGVRVVFRDFDTEGRRFSADVETAAYRIVQEALTNVARHAAAGEATVTLMAEDDVLRVEVEDRGAGFDPHENRPQQSFGLTGMRERANILGGRFMIHSSAGAGTRVVAELPLRAA